MVDDERGFTDEVWSAMTELGWTGLLVPEARRRSRPRARRHGRRARGDGPLPVPRAVLLVGGVRDARGEAPRRVRPARRSSRAASCGARSRSRSSVTATRSTGSAPAPGARAPTGCVDRAQAARCSTATPPTGRSSSRAPRRASARSCSRRRRPTLVPGLDPTRKIARLELDDRVVSPHRTRRRPHASSGAASSTTPR